MSFDPYRKWLGIPPKDQPPNHYRLLSLELFEDDPDIIEGSADRLMGFVRQYQSGEHAAFAAKILNELATARLCLLKPATKAAYDAKLRQAEVAASKPELPGLSFAIDIASAKQDSQKPTKKSSKPGISRISLSWIIGAGIAAVFVVVLVVGRRTTPAVDKPANTNVATEVSPAGRSDDDVKASSAAAKEPTLVSKSDEVPAADDVAQPKNSIVTSHVIPQTDELTANATANEPPPAAIPTGTTAPSAGTPVSQSSQPAETGEWVNLLEWTEGVDWASRGFNWNENIVGTATGAGITLKQAAYMWFPLAAIIDGDYDLEAEFTRTDGRESVMLQFPVGIHSMRLMLGNDNGTYSNLAYVDGNVFGERRPGTLSNNQTHRVLIRVRDGVETARFSIDLDDNKDYISWSGRPSALANLDVVYWRATMVRHPWIGSWGNNITFHKFRVRMLSGTIRRDVITSTDQQQDLTEGFVRLVGEKPLSTKVGALQFYVNQIEMNGVGDTERRWPLITRDFKVCDEYYRAHTPSRLRCPIPTNAKSFTVVAYDDCTRVAKFNVFMDGKLVYGPTTGITLVKLEIPAKTKLLELVTDSTEDSATRVYWCYPRFHTVNAERVTAKMLDGKPGTLKFRILPSEFEGDELASKQSIKDATEIPLQFDSVRPCDEFLFAAAPSTVTYQVPEGMTRFTAIGYTVYRNPVKYEVWSDGRQIFESPKAGIVPIDVKLPAGTKTIELKISELGANTGDLSMWCYPRLHRK